MDYEQVRFDTATTVVSAEQYRAALGPDLAVATIIHASPVTGMHVDVGASLEDQVSQLSERLYGDEAISGSWDGRALLQAFREERKARKGRRRKAREAEPLPPLNPRSIQR